MPQFGERVKINAASVVTLTTFGVECRLPLTVWSKNSKLPHPASSATAYLHVSYVLVNVCTCQQRMCYKISNAKSGYDPWHK